MKKLIAVSALSILFVGMFAFLAAPNADANCGWRRCWRGCSNWGWGGGCGFNNCGWGGGCGIGNWW